MGSKAGYRKCGYKEVKWIGLEDTAPPELVILADKWTEIAKHTDFKAEWYVKNASIVFNYKGVWYTLGPEDWTLHRKCLNGFRVALKATLYPWMQRMFSTRECWINRVDSRGRTIFATAVFLDVR